MHFPHDLSGDGYICLAAASLFDVVFNPGALNMIFWKLSAAGSVAYELCRPVSVYNMWFARTVATRASATFLRCWPVLILGALLPAPYGISARFLCTAAPVGTAVWHFGNAGFLGDLYAGIFQHVLYCQFHRRTDHICLSYRFSPGICHPLALHAGWDPPGLGASALCRHLECSPCGSIPEILPELH